jgi:hypothetical protein
LTLKRFVLLVSLCVLANNGKAQRNTGGVKLSKGVYIDSGVLKTEKDYYFLDSTEVRGQAVVKNKIGIDVYKLECYCNDYVNCGHMIEAGCFLEITSNKLSIHCYGGSCLLYMYSKGKKYVIDFEKKILRKTK